MKSLALAVAALSAISCTVSASPECRCFPGDACWPSEETWSSFNASVDGRLIRTVPLASVCHDPQYDEAACRALQGVWIDTPTHIESSHSLMSAYYANASCDPFTDRSAQCVVGTYVQYAVNASGADDVSKSVRFAHENNIRLVIRNTGHDYLGKSTGAGALGIWTKNLKSLEVTKWNDAQYQGDAIKVGAGIDGAELAEFASRHGLVTMSGNCPSVGAVGGFLQGGGHGPLASKLGMAADQALEYEVVDGTGEYLVANRRQNPDLLWALGGGGGGTYGVVVSATLKAHPDFQVTFGMLSFASAGLSEERFYGAVAAFQDLVPVIVDAGCVPIWYFTPEFFALHELICPDLSEAEVSTLLEPFHAHLQGIEHKTTLAAYDSYRAFQKQELAPWLKSQANVGQAGNWLMPRSLVVDDAGGKAYLQTLKEIVTSGAVVVQMGYNVAKKPGAHVDNAVNPAWRDTLIDATLGLPWDPTGTLDEGYAALARVQNDWVAKLAALAPDGAAYLNEADPVNANWKRDFYGLNYDRLLEIKNRYDPDHLFYALTAVGSDYWVEEADKRLCKAGDGSRSRDEL